MLLFSLLLEICFDAPAKGFSNQLCKIMIKKDVDDENMFANFKSFIIDICGFIKSQIFVISLIMIEYSIVIYLLINKKWILQI